MRRETIDRRTVASGVAVSFLMPLVGTACAAGNDDRVTRTSGFASFAAAASHWQAIGGTLLIDADHVVSAPITVECVSGLSYHLTTDGPRTLKYAGPQFHWFFCMLSRTGRNPLRIDGALTIDGGNACSMPLFVRFENVAGGDRRDLTVEGLTATNAHMRCGRSAIDGSPTNAYGATAMVFTGGFATLVLRQVKAVNVTRDAGAGDPGHQGCAGICVTGAMEGTASPQHITIEDFDVANIDSGDPPGSPRRGDMDGVLVFQAPQVDSTRPIIQRGVIRNAAGRAIKVFAPGGGGVTRDLTIYRSVHGNTGGSNDIAHQHGDGTIENITIYYSGDAHSQPTTPIGMSSGTARAPGFPFGTGTVRNVAIHDSTGQPKRAVVTFFYNVAGDRAPRRYLIQHVIDQGSAGSLFRPGILGADGPAEIDIDDVSVDLRSGLLASEDITPYLKVVVQKLVNRAVRPVPFKVSYNGNVAPRKYGGDLVAAGPIHGMRDVR